MTKLFNIQSLLHDHYETTLVHSSSLRALQQYQVCNEGHHGLGDLNVIKIQNKQNTFINR
jgi:hypothetical protein